ncbi:hypothetical protein SCHPADRAFT_1001977 [Schizopora paradoxa]|uniref:Uncharacterized protein n=1 Tax=Schizopora paradoxa TaxID=27342 RepID=A0A0H2R5D3_9AGAM|nr:hypothetical protein SCHPADRAFT_1001977 [Schizopora paradoxa]
MPNKSSEAREIRISSGTGTLGRYIIHRWPKQSTEIRFFDANGRQTFFYGKGIYAESEPFRPPTTVDAFVTIDGLSCPLGRPCVLMSVSSSTPIASGTVSPSFTSASTVQQPSTSSTAVVNDGPPGISKSSSLLFGFLVTFLVLFVAFMACGMSSRRAMDRRRRRGLAGLSGGTDVKHVEMHRPPLWDVWISSGKACWRDMMPLSVKVIRREVPTTRPEDVPEPVAPLATSPIASPDYFPTYIASGRGIARVAGTPAFLSQPRRSPTQRQTTGTSSTNPNPNPNPNSTQNTNPRVPPTERSVVEEFIRPMQASWALLLRYVRIGRWGSDAVTREEGAASGGNDERAGEPVEALRVSVLIAMPAPSRSSKSVSGIDDDKPDGRLSGEFALGVLDVPWQASEGKDCTFG